MINNVIFYYLLIITLSFFKVSKLLHRGANINEKTLGGISTLHLAFLFYDGSMVKLLLRNGVKVNETSQRKRTALHFVASGDMLDHRYATGRDEIYMLLDNGADLNIGDRKGETPLTLASKEMQEILTLEIAKLKFEGQTISPVNLEFIKRNKNLQSIIENSHYELKRLADSEFYEGFTLYDFLKMRKHRKKLAYLTKNDDFVKAFDACRNREFFKLFGDELDRIFAQSFCRGTQLDAVENDIRLSFKNYKYVLPDLVISKISYFVNEDLFY